MSPLCHPVSPLKTLHSLCTSGLCQRVTLYREIALEQFYAVMKGLRPYYHIVPLGSSVVDKAYQVETKDFEDALQYYAAEQAGADCIVTRNLKDFDFSFTVKALKPRDFLSIYFPEEL